MDLGSAKITWILEVFCTTKSNQVTLHTKNLGDLCYRVTSQYFDQEIQKKKNVVPGNVAVNIYATDNF